MWKSGSLKTVFLSRVLIQEGPASLLVAVHRYGEYTVVDGGAIQTYGAKYLTDASLSVDVGKVGTFKIGANNLFDVKPDKNEIRPVKGRYNI